MPSHEPTPRQRCLFATRLRTAGDDDVEPGCDRHREERSLVNGQRPELDELVETVGAHHETCGC